MKLSPRQRKLVGALTWWPPVYMVIFFVYTILWTFGIMGLGVGGAYMEQMDIANSGTVPLIVMSAMFISFAVIFVAHVLTILLMLGLLAFYIMHVIQNTALPDDQRLMWVLLVLFAGPIGQLIYYYKVMKAPSPPPAPAG